MFKLKSSLFVLPICVICFLISVIRGYASEESLTITTYYPSPYGVYNELRLYPHNCSSPNNCNASQQGLMCYDNTTTPGIPKVCEGGNWVSIGGGVSSGAVMSFKLTSCPSGWSELTAARGRYLVGLPAGAGGSLAAEVGTALSNQENRPVGRHSHGITDPSHGHSSPVYNGGVGTANPRTASADFNSVGSAGSSGAVTGITINNAGSVADTNAPYLQLLVCQKD